MKGSTRTMLLESLAEERNERKQNLAHAMANYESALEDYKDIAIAEIAAWQSLVNATEAKIQQLKNMRKVVK